MMEWIAKIVELCAYFGAGSASVGNTYQPELPEELR